MRDGFRYRISRESAAGTETIEVPEQALPVTVTGCVKDELI
jgi:G:T-mismatch repair DNA endonuclease (very short patch repair protein)